MTPFHFAGNANSWTDFINLAHYFGSIIQQPNFTYITHSILRTTGFPQSWKSIEKSLVMESHGKVIENGQKNKVMEILKKSWNFFTADHESRTRSSDNSISTGLL